MGCLQETHFRIKDKQRLKMKSRREMFHANTNEKNADVPTLTS